MNNELHTAILVVLTTQFKKDMERSFKVVQEAGYEISKWNSHWYIKSPVTGKSLWAEGYSYVRIYSSSAKTYQFHWESDREDRGCKADIVSMLNTPINKAWREYQALLYWGNDYKLGGTDFRDKREKYLSAKNAVDSCKRNIRTIKHDMIEAQNRLESQVRAQVKLEEQLVKVRKELGLIK